MTKKRNNKNDRLRQRKIVSLYIVFVAAVVILLYWTLLVLGDVTAPKPPQPNWTFSAKCVRVVDGDTIEVELKRTAHIRILDIDAPERNENGYFASKSYLERIVLDKQVLVEIPQKERIGAEFSFQRLLGYVYQDGVNVGRWMVDDGYAKER